MADDEMRDKEDADGLDPAFDSIDATMKGAPRRNIKVTPEALAQIVNEAVEKAISAYKQSRSATPESAGTSETPAAAPLSPWRAKIEQLQGDMGLDEIEFDGPPAEAAETRMHRELSSQMGVQDFEFEDARGPAAEADAPTRTDADAMAGWATKLDAIAGWVTPVQNTAPPETPVIDQTPPPAAAEEKIDDADPRFDWVAAELKRLEADETPTALDLKPPWNPAPQPEVTALEPLPAIDESPAAAIEEPPAAPKQEVRETRGGLTGWLRSALGDKSPVRKPAAAVPEPPATAMPVPAPAAPVVPAAAPPPEPVVASHPPRAAPPEEQAEPARDPAAALKSVTPEEAAKTTFFTFEPFPPVPARLPRESTEPKKD